MNDILNDILISKKAICVLARGHKNLEKYETLIARNNAISEVILKESKAEIDVIIFHEGNINQEHQQYINKNSKIKNIKYVSVEAVFNEKNYAKSKYCTETRLSNSFGYGYKCMCKFWFSGFIEYTKNYDYVIRIDDDCIIEYFNVDATIEEMKQNKIRYVAASIFGNDEKNVTIGIEKLCNDFINENKIHATPRFDYNPYTNLFIIDAKYFRSNETYLRFSSKVNSSGCIFINRWGDHLLWGVILSILPDDNIFNVNNDIKYLHGSHRRWINANIKYENKKGIYELIKNIFRKIQYKLLSK
jgi:hypothetical protein